MKSLQVPLCSQQDTAHLRPCRSTESVAGEVNTKELLSSLKFKEYLMKVLISKRKHSVDICHDKQHTQGIHLGENTPDQAGRI